MKIHKLRWLLAGVAIAVVAAVVASVVRRAAPCDGSADQATGVNDVPEAAGSEPQRVA